ncbi:MAG: GNAT family N-acetyltransferase [Anaerolineales bacterium]
MEQATRTITVNHDQPNKTFEVVLEGQIAVLNYLLEGDTITFTYTGVPAVMEGQGIGSCLVKAGLEYARANSLRVASRCSFVDNYIARHPEYQDLLK